MTDIPLDKFYTPDATARQCIGQLWRQVGMRADDLFIEPSAGAGAFCRHLPAKRGSAPRGGVGAARGANWRSAARGLSGGHRASS